VQILKRLVCFLRGHRWTPKPYIMRYCHRCERLQIKDGGGRFHFLTGAGKPKRHIPEYPYGSPKWVRLADGQFKRALSAEEEAAIARKELFIDTSKVYRPYRPV
jgi:hypothetical protein